MEKNVISDFFLEVKTCYILRLEKWGQISEMFNNPSDSCLGFCYLQAFACLNCTVLTSIGMWGSIFYVDCNR